jgi:hypothetical protein
MTLPTRSVLLLLDASTTKDPYYTGSATGTRAGYTSLYNVGGSFSTMLVKVYAKSFVASLSPVHFSTYAINVTYNIPPSTFPITCCLGKIFSIRENYLNSYLVYAYRKDWIYLGASTTLETEVRLSNSLFSSEFSQSDADCPLRRKHPNPSLRLHYSFKTERHPAIY